MSIGPHQVAVGLETALWESGPNHLTEFADTLEFEGKPQMPPHKKEQWDALGRFRDHLTLFLVGKKAAFIGGVAVRSYGGRVGATTDYDLLVEEGFLKPVTSFLLKETGDLKGSVEDTYLFHIASCALDIDIRVARSPLDKEALAKAKAATFMGRKLKVVRPAHLAAMKVKAFRERKEGKKGRLDREDVQGLVDSGATDVVEIQEVLKRRRPDLLSELDEILAK